MAGNNTDASPHGLEEKPGGRVIGPERLDGPEYRGMVGNDTIVATGFSLINQRGDRIQREKDSAERLTRFPREQADIIPIFRQGIWAYLLKDLEKILDCWHDRAMFEIKRGTPVVDVPLCGHCL